MYQAARLFELLPQGPNELWQMDVTYVHIPGFRVVVRGDGNRLLQSRYLLRLSLDGRATAPIEVIRGFEAGHGPKREWIHGPLQKTTVLGDRQRFVVPCAAVHVTT